jgi:hypothetical protein
MTILEAKEIIEKKGYKVLGGIEESNYIEDLLSYLQNIPTIKEDHDDPEPHIRGNDEILFEFITTMENKFNWTEDKGEIEYKILSKKHFPQPSPIVIKRIQKDIYGF